MITFDTRPDHYKHWQLAFDGPIATLSMDVREDAGLSPDYKLMLNSYDLGVDIELADAIQRIRFEHPEVRAVIITSLKERIFCAGANIMMLRGSSHGAKVNFCKFTNETRLAIEDASAHSGLRFLAALNGICAGGGYELALACDEIVLVDDGNSAVSLPEAPLLAVLPGTGGLTRVVDKRHVRRDLADVFATRAEGIKGQQAVDWGLVDAIAPRSRFDSVVAARAAERAAGSSRPVDATGFSLAHPSGEHVTVQIDRDLGAAHLTVHAPRTAQPSEPGELDPSSWVLAAARDLDDAILRLRFDEPEIGTWILHTSGDAGAVLAAEDLLRAHADHWLVNEIRLLWTRVLKRLDLSARTLVALVDPGSCFAGVLAELALAADRSFMLDGPDPDGAHPEATLRLTDASDGWFPMCNGLSRLATRFWGRDGALATARDTIGKDLLAADSAAAELVTFTPDDIDWDDDVRLMLEERNSFSPDALTAMEANYRFVGPETMETKIFARLTAWQNWVFQRPNAVGPEGALRRYGTGTRPTFDRNRV